MTSGEGAARRPERRRGPGVAPACRGVAGTATRRAEPPRPAPAPVRRRGEGGSASYEMVLLLPVLMLMVLFVLWAGRTGQARLAADLAAEEALVAAAVCCDPADTERREQVVATLLGGRPDLDFLCLDEPWPLAADGRFVSQTEFYFEDADDGSSDDEPDGAEMGVGVLGLGFGCTTDGAVGTLGGVLPPTEIRARAAEVVLLEPRPAGTATIRPSLRIATTNITAYEQFDVASVRLVLDRPAGDDGLSLWWLTERHQLPPNATARLPGNEAEFGYCPNDIDDEGDSYVPGSFTGRHRDYADSSGQVLFQGGETSATIQVDLYNDCLYEPEERFRVKLYGVNEAEVIVDSREASREAVITIRSDDLPPYLFLVDPDGRPDDPDHPVGDREVQRAEGEDLALELQLVNDEEQPQRIISGREASGSLDVVTGDSTASAAAVRDCAADYDWTPAGADGRFAFAAMTAAPRSALGLSFPVDNVYEGDEILMLEIRDPIDARLLPDENSSLLRIVIRDDVARPDLLLVDPDDPDDPVGDRVVELREGQHLDLRVRLVGSLDGTDPVSARAWGFEYSASDPAPPAVPAVAGSDFAALPSGPVRVEACASPPSAPERIRILSDGVDESDEESFVVTVSIPRDDPLDDFLDFTAGDASRENPWSVLRVVILPDQP
ncbi:MAG: pilus assembly protein [bacterium]|nr:pilus assembly protein [bacterium]